MTSRLTSLCFANAAISTAVIDASLFALCATFGVIYLLLLRFALRNYQ